MLNALILVLLIICQKFCVKVSAGGWLVLWFIFGESCCWSLSSSFQPTNNNNNTTRSISQATEANACNARETQSKVRKFEGGSTSGGGGGGACRVWEIIN